MRKLVLSSLCAVALLALVACEPVKSPPPTGGGSPPPAPAPPPPEFLAAPGQATHYLTVTYNGAHGNLTTFAAYYEDGYVHGDIIPATNGPVNDLEHFTCANQPSDTSPLPPNCHDKLFAVGPNDLGTLDQAHTPFFHNLRADKNPGGSGPALQWTTYEHEGHTQFEFDFADGYELYVTFAASFDTTRT